VAEDGDRGESFDAGVRALREDVNKLGDRLERLEGRLLILQALAVITVASVFAIAVRVIGVGF